MKTEESVPTRIGLLTIAIMVLGVSWAVGASAAVPGYPPALLPATCPTPLRSVISVDVGATETASESSIQVFGPGTAVSVTFDGQPIETVTAPADGLVTLTISVTNSGGSPEVSIDGKPAVAAQLGTNTLSESGVDATLGQDGTLTCPGTLVLDPPESPAHGGGSNSGAPSGSGPLAFTGLDLEALLLGSAFLVVAGASTVWAARRRARGAARAR
ncbi:MAG TPA: hypothetical protein VHV57_09935 [Acidimicrobiales bacterium]|jgi:hypothetical protein|nr:hypothetical protein [Acidimicrobiales bacterium]